MVLGNPEDGNGPGAEAIGAMNALRTGNVVLDMMIAMCIPVIFQFLLPGAVRMLKQLSKGDLHISMLWHGPHCERLIEHKTVQDMWGDVNTTDRDTRNNVLIKAIQLFLDKRETKMSRSRVLLTSMTESERPCWWRDDDDCDEKTPAGKLKKYRLLQKAPESVWQPIGIYGGSADTNTNTDTKGQGSSSPSGGSGKCRGELVELRVEEEEEDKGQKAEKTVSTMKYRLRSRSPEALDAFINEAYQWYLGELKKMEDNSRYLYEMQVAGGSSSKSDRDEGGRRAYKRYKLSGEKTFSSLFFNEKEMLLKILKDFAQKSGKYQVSGYPHKLGLLLHGPPGTGKTSLIKAMAAHTERSIVNVPLARITTNQELMDIMFDQQYIVLGEEVPIKLGFKDVIFVMEDVDAASKVVHRRDGRTTSAVKCEEVLDAPPRKTAWELLLESNEEECREVVKSLMAKSERLKQAALSSSVLCGRAKMLSGQPHLGLLLSGGMMKGESGGGGTLEERAKEAKEAMEGINESYETAGKFIKQQAQTLKTLLEAGAEVDTQFEDELLGEAPSALPQPPPLTRVVSSSAEVPPLQPEEEDAPAGAMGAMDPMAMAMMASLMTGTGQSGGEDMGGGGASTSALMVPSTAQKDKLNLSGLLNVLDGVVDTPERILIMTTNHPEHLDPALIRPGRIDKKILLSYMQPVHVCSMIEHYFQCPSQALSQQQRERVTQAILGSQSQGLPAVNLTPAQVEQLAAEHDEVEEMIAALEAKGKPFVTAPEQVADQESKSSEEPLLVPRPLFKTSSTKVYFDQ